MNNINKAYEDLKAALIDESKIYSSLTKEQRESEEGKNCFETIKGLSLALSEIDKTVARFTTSIGNYKG